MLQQAADKMSVSQLYGNVCATTSLANATTSLANATTSLAALALRDGTDVAALALCAAVGAGGADCLRGTQQSCPDGKVLVCFDGVRVGLVPFKERARLAVLDEHKQLVGSLLGDDRAATMLRAVQVIVSALRTFVAGLRRPQLWQKHSCACGGDGEEAFLRSYVPQYLLPRLHAVMADEDWYWSLEDNRRGRCSRLRRAVKIWCRHHPDIHLDPLLVPAPLPCPGSSLLQRLADLPFASISMLFHPLPSLGGTQPVTAHTPINKAQAPPLLFGWSGMQHPEWPWRGMVHSLRLRDMVAAETAREEARLLDFYAAIEAADAIAVDFHPGFASAVFDSFGVGDTVAVAARGVACGGLAEVEEMAEGEALGAVLDEGEDEWDLREGCSVQSGA